MPFGEKPGKYRLRCRAVDSLQSGFSRKNREIRACFPYFGVRGHGISLQLKLAGGEGGIRTLETGVSPYNGLAILYSDLALRNLNDPLGADS